MSDSKHGVPQNLQPTDSVKKYEMGKNEERDTEKPRRMCSLFFSSGQQGDSNPLQSSGRCLLLM